MADAFKIPGPALVSFSGGRTSGLMLWRILQAYGGALPDDVRVTFANTGREMAATLDFVRDCGERWGVPIVWLEYAAADKPADRWRIVDHGGASRAGEPFAALIRRHSYLPNVVARFCTQDLKIRVMKYYARSLGWETWTNVVGLRADEAARVARLHGASESDRWDVDAPLWRAGITKADVTDFWAQQNFDLALPNSNGKTPLGNCDLCFLKGVATLGGIVRERPELAKWWIAQEDATGGTFSKRFTYAQIAHVAATQPDLLDEFSADRATDCFCTGDA